MLRLLARFIAACCALAFVVVAVGVIFFQAAGTRFLQAPIYKRALVQERFYSRVPALAADLAVRAAKYRSRVTGDARDALDVLAELTVADWERLVGAVAPAAYLQAQAESGLDQLAKSLHADSAALSVEFSLVELKRRLASPEAEAAILEILQRRPAATPEEIQQAGRLPAGRRPPDAMLPQVREQLRTGMRSLVDRLPDTCDPFAAGPNIGGGRAVTALSDSRDTLLTVERWARWSPALPAVLLLLVALFGVRSLRGGLLWWGIPCFLAGAAAALLALPVVPATHWAFSLLIEPLFPPAAPAALIAAVFGVATDVVQEVMTASLISACWLGGGGLVCMILAHFCPRKAPATGSSAPG